jgi:hypothetical protein
MIPAPDVLLSTVQAGTHAAAWLVLLAAAVLQSAAVLKAAPRRTESVVDVAKDPLSKGDDASLAHVRFAHMAFLPLSLLALAVDRYVDAVDLRLAGYHWLLAGYGLLSVYGLSHLIVPRLSKVPAIAAGAIKGELHSSLLGLLLLAIGFIGHNTHMLVAGGSLLFFGAFVFMGVLGANIMKNKSRTQRVTPEFAYIPWTFAGVFWLITGVLLGLFLNAAVARFPEHLDSLAFVHAHAALYGGFGMLLMGFATRILPDGLGRLPIPFQRTKWAFYGLNVGLILLFYGQLTDDSTMLLSGGALCALASAGWFISLLPSLRAPA